MKIDEVLSQHRNDFTARMVCEHCGHTAINKYGYSDTNYYERVIPAMLCAECGVNGEGGTDTTNAYVNVVTL